MKKFFIRTKIVSLILVISSIIYWDFFYEDMTEAYKCKVLETYTEQAGRRSHTRYTAVIHIIKLNKTTSINLSTEGYYFANKHKKSGKIVEYYLTKKQISYINDGHRYHDTFIIIRTIILSFCIVLLGYYLCNYNAYIE